MWASMQVLVGLLALMGMASAQVLHTSSRWILNSSNQRVKFRCANWAGHMEVNIPEGLQYQSAAYIANWIGSNGFNCVRLTYSIDMALNPNLRVSDSFTAAASPAGVSTSTMQSLYNSVVSKNPWIANATVLSTFARVIDELKAKNVMVVLDNHNSRAGWCCTGSDGNGWWDAASGYNDANSRYFNTNNWLNGLSAMASFAASHSNVVGMSLRNELRASGGQDGNNHADWYKFVGQGLNAIHSRNPNLLMVVGGPSYATDIGFLYNSPLDRSAYPDKIVWEFHNYRWSWSYSSCDDHQSKLGQKAGFLLIQNRTFTGPLWLSEFGWNQDTPTAEEKAYYTCLANYMQGNDAEWAYWGLQGSYYVRDKQANFEETFGLVKKDWSDWRNGTFRSILGSMFDIKGGP
ncbi:glycosyl hydrolase family 5 protein/cellulase [Earliella scabrosa]|nr:glycosyl hydrolase family 5 protein/cellulase [Earliella scabrosa]